MGRCNGAIVFLGVLICFTVAVIGGARGEAAPGLSAIWAVDDGEKVFQDDLDHPLKSGGGDNTVWDGMEVSLFAARNEIVAFQLILEANPEGGQQVNVVVSDLTNGGNVIPGSHPLPAPNDYVGVGVELFTEHYLHVTEPSYNDPGWGGFYTTYEANPMITGWIPDGLIPFSAAAGMGGAPFDIGASLNQGVWCDIYVDKSLPPGIYTGTITVTHDGATVAEIPLDLEVLDLTLPDENHYRSMVFYSDYSIRPRHNLAWGAELWEMLKHYNRMAHRHRIELIGCGTWDEIANLGGALTGDMFTPAEGYEGPGEGIGYSLFSVSTYGVSWADNEAAYRTESDAWVNWFDANAPDIDYFLYLTDEPGAAMYPWIVERAGWVHNNPGPGHRLPVFVTKWPLSQLIGAVDIWSMQAPWYDPEDIEAARARGERAWIYAGNRPQTPMDVMDEYGVAFRIKPWVAYKCDVRRWFTWESSHWEPNSNEVPNDVSKNVFVDPVTFYAGYPGSKGNGDGTLFYPGEDYVYPAQNRDYPGPMSSIRMKMYRRGIQDYEYMWLAQQAGEEQDVQNILASVLPHVMWDAETVPDWSNSNATYEDARWLFAQLLGPPRAPLTDFSGEPLSGAVSLTVSFTDQSIFSPTEWSWDFGDGSTSDEQHPSHIYDVMGTYTVSLTATNAQGEDTETKVDYVTVGPPVAEVIVYADTWGTYDGGWAGVTVVSGGLDDLHEDDEVYMVCRCNAPNQQYSMWYTSDTPYTPDEVTKITVEYQAHCDQADTPDSLVFVRKSDGNFEYIESRLWDTADEWYTWETTDIAKYMSANGIVGFEVCGCPTNANMYDISSDVLRFRLEVIQAVPDPPVADFTGSPTSGDAPLSVSFTDLSANGPSAWDWDFGDGASSTEQHPTHEYAFLGDYTVSLTAANIAGRDTETKTDYISVVTGPEPPDPPVAGFAASTAMGTVPLEVTFADESTNSPTSWVWEFGDGSVSNVQNPSHTYESVGRYTVSLAVSNAAGSDSEVKQNCVSVGFLDMGTDLWAFDAIVACFEAGVVQGYKDGMYRPGKAVTRDQMAVFVSRALAGGDDEVPEVSGEPTFADVPADHWAFRHIEYAVGNNVVQGYDTGRYEAEWSVTRGQMAVFVARAVVTPTGEAGLEDYPVPEQPTFPDVSPGSWCFKHVEYLFEHDIVAGYPDGYYRPGVTVTRDQMAAYIARAFGLMS